MTSIFEQTTEHAPVAQPATEVASIPRKTAARMQADFAALLGKHPTYPPADWRAVGDPDAMALTVQYTVAWMEAAVVYKQPVSELPLIPTNEHGDPAAGSRSVFDACLEGFRGGMSPSEIKSAWDAALRDRYLVLSAEQEDVAKRGGDGRMIHLEGFTVRYALAPKPAAPKPPKSNG